MKNTKEEIFNEQSLREEIVKIWGVAGVHVEVFDAIIKQSANLTDQIKSMEGQVKELRDENEIQGNYNDMLIKELESLQKEVSVLKSETLPKMYMQACDDRDEYLEQQAIYDEQCLKAFEDVDKYYKEIAEHNDKLLKELEIPNKDFINLLDYSDVTDKMSVVEKPQGSSNDETCGVFKAVWVDQWSVGMEGDSYEGFIYGKLADGKWLKVPYSC